MRSRVSAVLSSDGDRKSIDRKLLPLKLLNLYLINECVNSINMLKMFLFSLLPINQNNVYQSYFKIRPTLSLGDIILSITFF